MKRILALLLLSPCIAWGANAASSATAADRRAGRYRPTAHLRRFLSSECRGGACRRQDHGGLYDHDGGQGRRRHGGGIERNADLDAAAIACASTWLYRPAIKDGVPVASPWKAVITWLPRVPAGAPGGGAVWSAGQHGPLLVVVGTLRRCISYYPVTAQQLAGIDGVTDLTLQILQGEVTNVTVDHLSGNATLDSERRRLREDMAVRSPAAADRDAHRDSVEGCLAVGEIILSGGTLMKRLFALLLLLPCAAWAQTPPAPPTNVITVPSSCRRRRPAWYDPSADRIPVMKITQPMPSPHTSRERPVWPSPSRRKARSQTLP